jgi:hypothetical protein
MRINVSYHTSLIIHLPKQFFEKQNLKRQDKEAIQNLYNNYMQTLINQKALEVPEAKKPWWRFW